MGCRLGFGPTINQTTDAKARTIPLPDGRGSAVSGETMTLRPAGSQ
jgi:hypothetical protein